MESPELLLWVVVGPELLVWLVGPGSWFGWWGLAPGMGGGAWLLVLWAWTLTGLGTNIASVERISTPQVLSGFRSLLVR